MLLASLKVSCEATADGAADPFLIQILQKQLDLADSNPRLGEDAYRFRLDACGSFSSYES